MSERYTEEQVNQIIVELQDDYGERLASDEWQALGELIDAGHDPASAFEAVTDPDDGAWDDEPAVAPADEAHFLARFEETVASLEEKHGRELSETELTKLFHGAQYEDNPRHVQEDAIHDVATKKGRVALIDERIRELDTDKPAEAPEVIAPIDENATKAERVAHINQRLAGSQVDPDQDPDYYDEGDSDGG